MGSPCRIAITLAVNAYDPFQISVAHHPRIIVPVRRVRRRLCLVVESSSLHLLAKRDEIRLLPLLQPPLFVRPERPRGPDTGLYLVDDKERSVFFGDRTDLSEKVV